MPEVPLKQLLRDIEQDANCSFDKPLKFLGKGGFGLVVQGTFAGHKAPLPVAVKIAKSSSSSQKEARVALNNEVNKLSRLSTYKNPHPHIIQLICGVDLVCSDDPENKIMIMELCRLGSLRDHMRKNSLPLDRLKVLHHICIGLAYMHSKGIYHRDLKPENILLQFTSGVGYSCKIGDFGVATYERHSKTLCGTALYQPPERDWAIGTIDTAKCDVFAVGVIFHELLIGIFPWIDREDLIGTVARGDWQVDLTEIYKSFLTATWAFEPHHRESARKLEARAGKLLLEYGTSE